MELALSLGDSSKPFSFLAKDPKFSSINRDDDDDDKRSSSDPPLQLHLRLPWLTDRHARQLPVVALMDEATVARSSPNNSAASSFQMDFGIVGGTQGNKRDMEGEHERAGSSRGGSDDDENGSTRKKLRLSKEQSAFLEESFKQHNTLNPKQKLGLAKQLNLRPRQVEVWFQNRRARTKLKQTEVDCEYLKRCFETLTEENKRLQKELQELRALKSSQPFYMHSPATTLTMCPSRERVVTGSTITTVTAADANVNGSVRMPKLEDTNI